MIAQRQKTFRYTVTESNTVAGITNGAAQEFYVTVTDNGDGTVSAVARDAEGNALTPGAYFSITNTC